MVNTEQNDLHFNVQLIMIITGAIEYVFLKKKKYVKTFVSGSPLISCEVLTVLSLCTDAASPKKKSQRETSQDGFKCHQRE